MITGQSWRVLHKIKDTINLLNPCGFVKMYCEHFCVLIDNLLTVCYTDRRNTTRWLSKADTILILKEKTMFDKEFLEGLLAKEDVDTAEKVRQIIAEHEASERGLVDKKNELLEKERSLKDKLDKLTETEKANKERISELEASRTPSDEYKLLEGKYKADVEKLEAEKQALSAERDSFKASHYRRLRDDAIAEGIKDIQFVDGLKDGFISCILQRHNFEPVDREVNGQKTGEITFVDRANGMKSIQDVLKDFATSNEGKAYIRNPSSGGNAGTTYVPSTLSNPFVKGSKNYGIDEQIKLYKENPALYAQLKAEAQR